MRIFIFIHFALLLAANLSFGQNTFQKVLGENFGNSGTTVEHTSDGGYIILGATRLNGTGSSDVYLLKLNSDGDTIWSQIYGSPINGADKGSYIIETSDGGYAITGSTKSFGAGREDIFLIKTDPIGNIQWQRTYGGTLFDFANCIQQTTDNGFILTGSTENNGFGGLDFYVIRTNSVGDTIWTKILGGIYNDDGTSVLQVNDGGFLVGGTTSSFGLTTSDAYVIMLDSNGTLLWTKNYGSSIEIETCSSMIKAADDGYILLGNTKSFGAGDIDFYVVKIDTGGVLQWSKTYGSVNMDIGIKMIATSDSGYVLVGHTCFDSASAQKVGLFKIDNLGNLIFSMEYGGISNTGWDVDEASDGGYFVLGHTYSLAQYPKIYIIKTDLFGISSCNEASINIISNTVTSLSSNIIPQITSGGVVGSSNFSIAHGGIDSTLCYLIGIEEASQKINFSIFPNPNNGTFSIQSSEDLTLINIFSLQGQKIFSNTTSSAFSFLSLTNIPNGIYIIQVQTSNPITISNKIFIVE